MKNKILILPFENVNKMFVFSMGVSIGNKKVKKKNYYPNQKKLPAKIGLGGLFTLNTMTLFTPRETGSLLPKSLPNNYCLSIVRFYHYERTITSDHSKKSDY